jgi:uracil-DNA glycosylase family 4
MLNERQRRAWNELELGPEWLGRQTMQGPVILQPTEMQSTEMRPTELQPAKMQPLPLQPAGQDAWSTIGDEVRGCRRCGLCETRRNTVFGSGPRDARWMLIGEAPGADEDASGEPFVGQAGKLLDQMLASIGLSRERDVFITNVLKCRPPGNRDPEPLEAATCSEYLYRQIDLLQPDLIVLLGRFAMQSVLKTGATIASLRQQVHHYTGSGAQIPIVCTYHPAYLLRNLPEKRKSWEDLCLALDVAGRQQERRREAQAALAPAGVGPQASAGE